METPKLPVETFLEGHRCYMKRTETVSRYSIAMVILNLATGGTWFLFFNKQSWVDSATVGLLLRTIGRASLSWISDYSYQIGK